MIMFYIVCTRICINTYYIISALDTELEVTSNTMCTYSKCEL